VRQIPPRYVKSFVKRKELCALKAGGTNVTYRVAPCEKCSNLTKKGLLRFSNIIIKNNPKEKLSEKLRISRGVRYPQQ
jgi:hypothetical protein